MEPTILVKKTDGSTVKMTLTEFKEYQKLKKESVATEPVVQKPVKPVVQKDVEPKKPQQITPPPKTNVEPPANLPVVEEIKTETRNENTTEAPTVKMDVKKEEVLPAIKTPQNIELKKPAPLMKVNKAPAEKKMNVQPAKKVDPIKPAELKKEIQEVKEIELKTIEQKEKKLEEKQEKEQEVVEQKESLLETKSAVVDTKPIGAEDTLADRVLKKLSFKVANELQGRLRSLILSHIKDVRTDEQLREYSKKASLDGGLELNDAQVDEMLDLLRGVKGEKAQGIAVSESAEDEFLRSIGLPQSKPAEKDDVISKIIERQKQEVEGGLKKIPIPQPIQKPQQEVKDRIAPPIAKISSVQTEKKSDFAYKKPMHDVTTSQVEFSMGPVEEIRNLKLEDFRRFSKNPQDAKDKILGKLNTIASESYLLYLDAAEAWYESLLYKQYQDVLVKAINNGQKIQDTLPQNELNEDDVMAILEISKELKI